MTLVLELTDRQQERLQRYAARRGTNPQAILLEWVNALPEPTDGPEMPATIGPPFPNLVSYIAPDFDDPLPDEFWLGDSVNDPLCR